MRKKKENQITKESNDLKTTKRTIDEIEQSILTDSLQENVDKEYKDDNPIDETINDAVKYEHHRKQREAIANAQSKLTSTVYIEGTADVQEFLKQLQKTIDDWKISSCVETVEEAKYLIQLLKEQIKKIKHQNSYCIWSKIKNWWNNLN